MIKLESDLMVVTLVELGAEIKSVVTKHTGHERMWQANPDVWGRTAPVLFPIVGKLKDNTYTFNGQKYSLPQHGFARDQNFEVTSSSKNSVVFELRANEASRLIYPFDFLLQIEYVLKGNCLTTNYLVSNTGDKDLFFSLGAHPGFICAFGKEGKSNDYHLLFDKEELAERFYVEGGLISKKSEILLKGNQLQLNDDLFSNDALVFKNLCSENVELSSDYQEGKLKFKWEGFPYFGIWKKPGSDFICLEPWAGIADSTDAYGSLTEKEGILKLKSKENYKAKIEMYFS